MRGTTSLEPTTSDTNQWTICPVRQGEDDRHTQTGTTRIVVDDVDYPT